MTVAFFAIHCCCCVAHCIEWDQRRSLHLSCSLCRSRIFFSSPFFYHLLSLWSRVTYVASHAILSSFTYALYFFFFLSSSLCCCFVLALEPRSQWWWWCYSCFCHSNIFIIHVLCMVYEYVQCLLYRIYINSVQCFHLHRIRTHHHHRHHHILLFLLLLLLLLLCGAERERESIPFPYLHSLLFFTFFLALSLSFVLSIFGTAILSSVILLSTKYNWDVWTLNTHYNTKWNIALAHTHTERVWEKILEKITLNHMFLYFGNSERISFAFFFSPLL